jgi:hypothetical protein
MPGTTRRLIVLACLTAGAALGCGSGGPNGGGGGGPNGGGGGGGGGAGSGAGTAAAVARKLGRAPNFLVGMGNDLAGADAGYDHNQDGVYTLGVTMDLHDAYMVGLPGQGGWPDWNAEGSFVNILSKPAADHGVTPMYTLYAMASIGDGNLSGLAMDSFMRPYWDGARLLFQRIAMDDRPALVHIEPDFWAYAQQMSKGNPAALPVHVKGLVPECAAMTDDLAGLGHCLLKLGRTLAPKAVLGLHASRWAGDVYAMVSFLNGVGAGEADVIVQDMLDRDAGCFEAHVDSQCQRNDGPWYWDESNQTSPNFHEYLDWAKAIGDGLHRPIVWWQVPFGVPSTTPGGAAGHYRDNRVHYVFGHVAEFIAAGGLGITFGVGAGNQTYITTDGGQFKNAVTAYFAAPAALP